MGKSKIIISDSLVADVRNISVQYYERRLAAQRKDIAVPAPQNDSSWSNTEMNNEVSN